MSGVNFCDPTTYILAARGKAWPAINDLEVRGVKNPASARYYPEPKAAAAQIKDFVAFWRGVTIEP